MSPHVSIHQSQKTSRKPAIRVPQVKALVQLNTDTGEPEVQAELLRSADDNYPHPRTLDRVGSDTWDRIVELLTFRGIMSKDWLEPLHTLCCMVSASERLRLGFEEYVLTQNSQNGNTKINPALAEWSRIVALLRGYYSDFGLTPSSIMAAKGPPGKTGSSCVVNRGNLTVENIFESEE